MDENIMNNEIKSIPNDIHPQPYTDINQSYQNRQYAAPAYVRPVKEDTEATKLMKENAGFFIPAIACYALFFCFCMFHNDSGVTFPILIAVSFVLLFFSLSKIGVELKKGSAFYMAGAMLLAISTFCTDDEKIITFNKLGIFLLIMSLLLRQFYDTSQWKLGKYLGNMFLTVVASLGELARPFQDMKLLASRQGKGNKNILYALLGAVVSVPLLVIVIALLSSADIFFRQITDRLLIAVNFENITEMIFQIVFVFFAVYLLFSYLCKHDLDENVKDHRTGEPIPAITVTALLSAVYMLFSCIQIFGLFLGKLSLPQGYSYAQYAREGFFQLLGVAFLNLVIVLVCLSFFKESKLLKAILTIMSLCTFIMIASSAMRMIIYIEYYALTFLRILVLWALALLFILFIGVIVNIYKNSFPLFRYCVVVVTVMYVALSYSHPDLIIAYVDTQSTKVDYYHLGELSLDAAPVMIPYMEKLGYDLESVSIPAADIQVPKETYRPQENRTPDNREYQTSKESFGHRYLLNIRNRTNNYGIRTFNISRYVALKELKAAAKAK